MTSSPLEGLDPRDRTPSTRANFLRWLAQAASRRQVPQQRVNRAVANALVLAVLQRAIGEDGRSRFLVKGGTLIELLLGLKARASGDLDTLFRGEFAEFLDELDTALEAGFGPFTFRRTEPSEIKVATRKVKPLRMEIKINLQGSPVLRVPLEVAPDEGGAGEAASVVALPSLAHFGIATPDEAASLAIEFQVAQKFHACTDPDTPEHPNLRVHDLVDLQLLHAAFFPGDPPPALGAACRAVFVARAAEANDLGLAPRGWPPVLVAHDRWTGIYESLAREVDIGTTLSDAVDELNAWTAAI